jgi:hypothetical protein
MRGLLSFHADGRAQWLQLPHEPLRHDRQLDPLLAPEAALPFTREAKTEKTLFIFLQLHSGQWCPSSYPTGSRNSLLTSQRSQTYS